MSGDLLANISSAVTSLSIETVVLILIVVGVSIYSFYVGRGKMMSLVLALLLAGGIYTVLEPLSWFAPVTKGVGEVFYLRILIFAGLVLLLSGTLDRVVHGRYSYSRSRRFAEVVILIVAFSGTLMAYGFNLLGFGALYQPSAFASLVFASTAALAGWTAFSLVSLFVASRL